MKVGITYNSKDDAKLIYGNETMPEDAFEEFDSTETIDAICSVLTSLGHECVKLGFGVAAVEKLLQGGIDFVFNIAEGYCGRSREAQIPALLEMLGIPFSGPDPLAAAITLDKIMAKKIAVSSGVETPAHFVIRNIDEFNLDLLEFPLILKLAYEGSSKGLRRSSKVNNISELKQQFEWLRTNYPSQPIIAERFIGGREFTVGVIGNDDPEVLGIMEIRPRREKLEEFVYSLEVKRNYLEEVDYFCPPNISDFSKDRIISPSQKLYRVFGCRDIARFDFRVDRDGTLHFIEVNPLPGLNPVSSDIVIMAGLLGISYPDLIGRIFNHALKRCNLQYAKV